MMETLINEIVKFLLNMSALELSTTCEGRAFHVRGVSQKKKSTSMNWCELLVLLEYVCVIL